MRSAQLRLLGGGLLSVAVGLSSGCGGWWNRSPSSQPPVSTTPPTTQPLSSEATLGAVRFLEARVKSDPDDTIAHNKLVNYYLKLGRETGDARYLELALHSAHASLAALPAEQNAGGLAALIQAEAATHQFPSARDHARQYIEVEPGKAAPYVMLFDAQIELGEYDGATATLDELDRTARNSIEAETRRARLVLLNGDPNAATTHLARALELLGGFTLTPADTVAWYHWQLGEIAFSTGQYETAESHYRDALNIYPAGIPARASLARVRAARGNIEDAIKEYETVTNRLPEPQYLAALGDLYQLGGREKEAAAQFALIDYIGNITTLKGTLQERWIAMFDADHDLRAEAAHAVAEKNYAVRQDIYGADILAWTALKAGKIKEAQTSIKAALRLGTKDAKLFYHAGMIARAAGDKDAARDYLSRALTLNPQFDLRQAALAQKALAEL